jgi:cell wall-associated NlpC family hydrolase
MKFRRVISLILVAGFLIAIPVANGNLDWKNWGKGDVFASTSGRDQAKDELDDLEDEMDELEDHFADLEDQLSDKAKELSDLLMDQEILENDIKATQEAIDQAEKDLVVAKEKEAQEYEAMKLRIQYMYENSTQDSVIDAILNANGVVDMLNRVEYVSQVHKSDRELLEEYKKAVEQVEILAATLEMEMNDLVTMREVYEHQEAALESALAQLEEEADNYEDQLATAKRRARELSDYIAEQNRLIALQQQQNNNNNNSSSGNSKPSTSGGYLNDPSYDPAFGSNVTGEELVNYALQFVGNPYKWGGNSLTNGCDCSGFVNLIYRHFGFKNVPRQSQAFKSYGQPVAFANIKAGDIVVYPGHVAIYIGNGKIVEAQSTRAGITCNRPVNCNTITAIRRVL